MQACVRTHTHTHITNAHVHITNALTHIRARTHTNAHAWQVPEVDVFAFGLILFEVLSEEQPWAHLQHLPMHEIEGMVQYGSRPRFKNDDMHGVATLVRLCLMPNHHERPSLADIVARVR